MVEGKTNFLVNVSPLIRQKEWIWRSLFSRKHLMKSAISGRSLSRGSSCSFLPWARQEQLRDQSAPPELQTLSCLLLYVAFHSNVSLGPGALRGWNKLFRRSRQVCTLGSCNETRTSKTTLMSWIWNDSESHRIFISFFYHIFKLRQWEKKKNDLVYNLLCQELQESKIGFDILSHVVMRFQGSVRHFRPDWSIELWWIARERCKHS